MSTDPSLVQTAIAALIVLIVSNIINTVDRMSERRENNGIVKKKVDETI